MNGSIDVCGVLSSWHRSCTQFIEIMSDARPPLEVMPQLPGLPFPFFFKEATDCLRETGSFMLQDGQKPTYDSERISPQMIITST